MKFKLLFFAAALLLATPNFAQITGKFGTYYDQRELLFEAMPTSENDIIFLGNSITDGGEWCELFQNANCKNRGISGDITSGVLNRLETITKGHPAMIFLMIGTNDMNWGISNDSVALGVREIVQRIKQESPRTRIVVQSILPTNDCYGMFSGHTKRYADVAIINGMLKTMAEEEDVEYLDLYSRFANEEGKMNPKYSNDGLHINGEGYLLWKEIVEDEIDRIPQPVRKSKVPIWINMGAGLDEANCYDNGTIPFSYLGIGANFNMGATIEWWRYHLQTETRFFVNGMFSFSSYAFTSDSRTEFLYRIHDSKRNRLHVWAGCDIQSFFDIKEIPALMNAAMGASIFENICAEGMLQYDFAFIKGGAHNLFTLCGKLNLPIAGLVMRPGYAYVDNYNSDINESNTIFQDYEMFGKWFPGVGTDIGLYFNLLNGNRIGFNYRWDYLSTGHKGTYRYDNAFHSFNVNLLFNVN
jgi:lysophospholipase L1-like esterase